jgi:DNA polymerase III delta prime subunit
MEIIILRSYSMCVIRIVVCSVSVQPDGVESLITLSEGDMRRALNILQVIIAHCHCLSVFSTPNPCELYIAGALNAMRCDIMLLDSHINDSSIFTVYSVTGSCSIIITVNQVIDDWSMAAVP